MNHVTRGMGKRSGMLVTAGLGRRVIFVLELLTQYISSGSRAWASATESRAWKFTALDRVWYALAQGRDASVVASGRVFTAISHARSWAVSKVRAWSVFTDRSHDA